jgi:AraC family transcriptional regulator, regulatory protein of adaptative response / methylated-DNA-[protein]-cysteine methyltransferase
MPRDSHAKADATSSDPRWAEVRTRQKAADGHFVYAVRTTGVYCRPSCAARTPRPENVSFHDNPDAAERAGFRACKRCKPNTVGAGRTEDQVKELCRLIEHSETIPTLEQLSSHIGLSVFHTQRLFKAATGVTPRAYAAECRRKRLRAELKGAGTVTQALYGAGYGSSSRLYEEANTALGMTPSQYKKAGAGRQIRFAVGQCSLGAILVAATDVGVCAVLLGDDPDDLVQDLERRFPEAELLGGDVNFEKLVAQVVGLVEAPLPHCPLPLDIRGTAFQVRVWQAIAKIPPGKTTTYTELAHAIGAPTAARAVASACGANAIAVAIPCHRVVRTDGSLSGYRWGVERKRALLDRERGLSSVEPQ